MYLLYKEVRSPLDMFYETNKLLYRTSYMNDLEETFMLLNI